MRELGLGHQFLIPLFRRWTEIDSDAALDALAAIENPGTARAIALEMVQVLGDDQRKLDGLAQLLPDGNRVNFELALLEHRVAFAPISALADAIALNDSQARESALLRIAFEWGNRDPQAALSNIELIPDRQDRREYFNYVLTRWARLDPMSALRYAVVADDQNVEASFFAIQTIVNRVPGPVLESADQFPPQMRVLIESYANRCSGKPLRIYLHRSPSVSAKLSVGFRESWSFGWFGGR